MKSKFYKVVCKCGHVGGLKHFIRIEFPVNAEDGKEAAAIARTIPRVQHDKKFAIISCTEIPLENYNLLKKWNSKDEYLKCKTIQNQREIQHINQRIEDEQTCIVLRRDRKSHIKYHMKKETEKIESLRIAQLEGDNIDELHVY